MIRARHQFYKKKSNKFKIKGINYESNFYYDNSLIKLSLDTKENFKIKVYLTFKSNIFFSRRYFKKKNFIKIFKNELR